MKIKDLIKQLEQCNPEEEIVSVMSMQQTKTHIIGYDDKGEYLGTVEFVKGDDIELKTYKGTVCIYSHIGEI